MQIKRHGANVHTVDLIGQKAEFLLISDIHWDNPHCDRVLLKKHLDEAVERNARIIVNGDFFCLMQGKGDPRRSKDDIRPEHNKGNYLQAVVNDAVEWWQPYASNLLLIGYGNHETSVLKHMEFDALQMFTTIMNHEYKVQVERGGYGGAILFGLKVGNFPKNQMRWAMKYYHGSGGGGPVTKGVIQDQRLMAMSEGYDCTWQGHVHELYHHVNMVTYLDRKHYIINQRLVHQVRTSTYKEEYQCGQGGFHVERGRGPKPMGGYWMDLEMKRVYKGKSDIRFVEAKFATTSPR